MEEEEELFRLAGRVVFHLKKTFHENRETIGNYYFKKSIIEKYWFDIFFSGGTDEIVCTLSIHHLDMPWNLKVKISNETGEISLNKWKQETQNIEDIVYEAYPRLLEDPENLGDKLAKEVAEDLLAYLKSVT